MFNRGFSLADIAAEASLYMAHKSEIGYQFLCYQYLRCVAYRDCFVIQFGGIGVVVGVCRRHTLYSGQYLKNGFADLIQIWHMDVTGPEGVLYSFVTLNVH